MGKLDIT